MNGKLEELMTLRGAEAVVEDDARHELIRFLLSG
jgi:hypothetical protein